MTLRARVSWTRSVIRHRLCFPSLSNILQTLRTIVPALIAQRRQRSKTREEMVHGMDEVLRIFVDAASHVPRHRRLQ